MASSSRLWFEISNGSHTSNATEEINASSLELRYSTGVTVILCVAYASVCALGVVGNCVVIAVVHRTPRMWNATNVFIANLACADLLVNVLCLPFTLLSNIYSAWILGSVICKTISYLQGVSVAASVHTLVAIAVERCMAICCPMRGAWMSTRTCYIIITLIWCFSFTVTLPWAFFFQLQPFEEGSDLQVCIELWPPPWNADVYFIVVHLILCYLAPLVVISICYTLVLRSVDHRKVPGEMVQGRKVANMMLRTKEKAIQMLVVVVASFALAWLPLYALSVWIKLGPPMRSPGQETFVYALLPIAQWLGASNSCVNPVLYAFFNRRFRAGYHSILTHWCCRLQYQGSWRRRKPKTTGLQRRGCQRRLERRASACNNLATTYTCPQRRTPGMMISGV